MLADFQEPFCRLRPQRSTDAAGGSSEAWVEGDHFMGGVTNGTSHPLRAGGLAHLRTAAVLIHEPGMTLHLHDRVCRLRDGAVFTVLGSSDDCRTPAAASQAYACVPVESVVTAL